MQRKTPIPLIRRLMRHEPDEQPKSFASWRDAILEMIPQSAFRDDAKVRLSVLDPGKETAPSLILNLNPRKDWKYWEQKWSEAGELEPHGMELVDLLADLSCSSDGAPYVARALIRNARLRLTGPQLIAFADRLKRRPDGVACSGIRGLTKQDWMELDG